MIRLLMSANDPKRTLAPGDRGEKPGVAVREEIAGSVALLARRLPPARQGVVLTLSRSLDPLPYVLAHGEPNSLLIYDEP